MPYIASGRGWLAGDWPSTGGVLDITAAAWTAGFQWWRSGDMTRTQNVIEYMLVLALYLVDFVNHFSHCSFQNVFHMDMNFVPGECHHLLQFLFKFLSIC